MGRSTSCFKIITCGSDSADQDDPQVPETKGPTDKRGWSFRKRSARHRILSNTVTSETPPSANKESPESVNLTFQQSDALPAPEKTPVIHFTGEKPQLSTTVESEKRESTAVIKDETIAVTKDETEVTITKDETEVGASKDDTEVAASKDDTGVAAYKCDTEVPAYPKESDVIIIQAAVRVLLAQKEFLKRKNVVKLQAAVRGHLVRQHAVGSLRCVQAIVKMQALVRARRNRLLIEGKDDHAMSKTSENEKSSTKPNVTYISIEKLLSNKFARQLMESTPKTKPINIKCDAERRNSAWNWLERWMSASSVEPTPKPEFTTEKEEEGRKRDLASPAETKDLSEGPLELADSKEIGLPSENEENLITYDAENFKFQACMPTASSVEDHLVQPQPVNSSSSDMKQTSDINCHLNQTTQFEAHSHSVPDAPPHEPEIEAEQPEQPKRSAKRLASEELETEGKKSVRKTINPSFIAAQNKFEGLSSSANSNLSSNSFHQDGVQPNTETVSSGADSGTRTRELNTSENLAPHNPKVHFAASECGTELSITSTLDSPDRSEVEAAEYGHEDKVLEQEISTPNITKDVEVEAKESPDPVPNLPDSVPEQPKILVDVEDESVNSVVNAETQNEELKPDLSASDIRREMDSEKGGPAYRSSPEASPRSRTTVPESQGTPSSQLSIKSRKNKTDKSGSSQKRKSLSAGKRSPLNHESGARSSVEQLPKDHKNGKRRNSMGSATPENENQEPRDSSSSSSLPHFMQATESARAKLNANSSPRSSPDVTDREYTKKRHSLPGANGRQGSPRIQRSTSHAQQGSKANGAPAIHEKKWQR